MNNIMSDAFSESLAYPQQKRRAVASRSYRVKINPSNGQTFTGGQTINIDMPSNLSGTYCNWNQCYLKFKANSQTEDLTLDRCGAYGFIERVQCQTAGAQIFDLPNWNVLMTILMDGDSSESYKAGVGNILLGTRGDVQSGEVLGSSDRVYCLPFVLHPFAMTTPHRLMPLFSLSPVQFKITLSSKALAGVSTAQTGALNFTEVELVCVFTELSPGAQSQVDQMTGGVYNMLASSYQNVGTTMAQGTVVTANLGVSVSSLERVIVCHRPTGTVSSGSAFNLGNRIKNTLTQYSIFINGEQYPARPVEVSGKGAEALGEFLLSDHSLVNFDKQSSLTLAVGSNGLTAPQPYNGRDGAGAAVAPLEPYSLDAATGLTAGGIAANGAITPSDIGSFITAVETETGLSDGKSARIYSGISTISSTVNYRGTYSAGLAAQLDFFCQFTVMLSLNMRGTGVYAISV
jgi:hypothetical protein